MVATYDETTDRAHPDYPGTSLQRWRRDLLRTAMEEGFTVFEAEWWHFDYKIALPHRQSTVQAIGR